MPNRNAIIPIGVIGLIIIACSISAFFLLDVERTAINLWALVFLLLSEFVFFGGLIRLQFVNVKHNKAFLKQSYSGD